MAAWRRHVDAIPVPEPDERQWEIAAAARQPACRFGKILNWIKFYENLKQI
jgi:hypothetical protein